MCSCMYTLGILALLVDILKVKLGALQRNHRKERGLESPLFPCSGFELQQYLWKSPDNHSSGKSALNV